jgi:hypothetical protein
MRTPIAIFLVTSSLTGSPAWAADAVQPFPKGAYAEVLNGPPFALIHATARRPPPPSPTTSRHSAKSNKRR